MKKTTMILSCLMFLSLQTFFATTHSIVTSGFTYSLVTTNAAVGDTISISASTIHPLVQVDQTTWNANTATPLVGGWGTKTATYTFTITSATDIYFVCANHVVTMGMKGMISVAGSGINSNNISYTIGMFPNPVTNGEFTVKAEGYAGSNGKILIYNTEGQLLETHNLTSVSTSIKSKLPSAVYFYDIIINQKQVYRGKFLMSLSK